MPGTERVFVVDGDEIEPIQLGDESSGTKRFVKVLATSKNMKVHMGIFPPGQASSRHSHPESEEIVFIVKGKGKVFTDHGTFEYKENSVVFIPPGVSHQYKNTGDDEMILIAIYSPPTELPSK